MINYEHPVRLQHSRKMPMIFPLRGNCKYHSRCPNYPPLQRIAKDEKKISNHSTHIFLKITQNVVFEFWHFPPIFVQLQLTCLVTLFDRKLLVFKNSPKLTIFGIFNEFLFNQNVNVARFARNVECDFFGDFQTL